MVESEAGFSPDAVGQYQHPDAGQHKGFHIFGEPLIHLKKIGFPCKYYVYGSQRVMPSLAYESIALTII